METETRVENNAVASENQKKIRHRKKQLYQSILQLMEFYFGDANLSKDRFLGGLIKEDPYVPLKVFLQFNKLKALTDNIDDIAKSLTKSDLLKLSEDETKVCRTTPIKERVELDECTIYVECLPPNIDHEWLRNIFITFGAVSYISIPRFKHNKKVKGFAFIEFEEPSSAQKCLEAFEEAGSKLLPDMNPDDLFSISTFEDPKQNKQILESTDNIDLADGVESKNIETVTEVEKSPKQKLEKRKLSDSEQSADERILTKKSKVEGTINEISDLNNAKDTEDIKPKIAKSDNKQKNTVPIDNANTSGVETEDNEAEVSVDNQKKKRKRKKQVKKKYRDSIASTGLKILSKKEWKKLRNKYLNLQRSKMQQLKKQLHLNRVKECQKKHPVQYQQNFYGGSDENNMEMFKNQMEPEISTTVEFTPGVIVNIKLKEACVDVKGFKAAIKNASEEIKYVDVNEGSIEAHIRFSESSFASKFVSSFGQSTPIQGDGTDLHNQVTSLHVLNGETEQEYWKKVARDKDNKRSKKIKIEKRGKDKLIAKALKNSHVHFDEDHDL